MTPFRIQCCHTRLGSLWQGWQAKQAAVFRISLHGVKNNMTSYGRYSGLLTACAFHRISGQASKAMLRVFSTVLLLQVFMATLVRGYAYTPKDVQEPWTTWPVGGCPVNGLPLQLERL